MAERFFFFHVPKCAGTSVWAALREALGHENVYQIYNPKARDRFLEKSLSERATFRAIGGHFDLKFYQEILDLKSYRTFTTFREPVGRILSEYYYTANTPTHVAYDEVSRMSLRDYIALPRSKNKMTMLLCGQHDADAALRVVDEVFDGWYFHSELDELVGEICEVAGSTSSPVGHFNTSPVGKIPRIDAEIAELIRKENEADIAFFAKLSEWRAENKPTRRSLERSLSFGADAPAVILVSTPVVHVVTPCFNCAPYLGEAIASVVSQAGDFSIRYHIQDGGSTDGSIEIAKSWQNLIVSGQFPIMCNEVSFSIHSEVDDGMYDALAKGFEQLGPEPEHLMTWINADDGLAPGAIGAVVSSFMDLPQNELVGGRTVVTRQDGSVACVGRMVALSRECMAAGVYDGRVFPFIMQEGTFWRASLWYRAGGIDTTFRLAGDWDLWRRFAKHADYLVLDTLTGWHRKRDGQLSSDLVPYYKELDSKLSDEDLSPAAVIIKELAAWQSAGTNPHVGRVADRDRGRWLARYHRSVEPVFNGISGTAWERVFDPLDGVWVPTHGFDIPEGPFPDLGIDTPVRWTVQPDSAIEIFSESSGERRLIITISGSLAGQTMEARIGDSAVSGHPCGTLQEPASVVLKGEFQAGWSRLVLRTGHMLTTPEGRRLGLLLRSIAFA